MPPGNGRTSTRILILSTKFSCTGPNTFKELYALTCLYMYKPTKHSSVDYNSCIESVLVPWASLSSVIVTFHVVVVVVVIINFLA